MKLHSDVQALLISMRELEDFLSGENQFWAGQVRRAADEVANSDSHGLQRFLGLFGGMGSLNDLVLYREASLMAAENERLDFLRERAWMLANSLKHEVSWLRTTATRCEALMKGRRRLYAPSRC